MKRISLDIFRIGKTKDERKTRFEQSNEDRVNMNFRKLQQAVEEVNAEKADSGDTYTKAEADALLSAKANSADVVPKSGGTFTGDVTFDEDVTVDGVLDVTQRCCYASMSSAGWYRVLTYAAASTNQALGYIGASIDLKVSRRYSSGGSEVHDIMLLLVNGKVKFADETSCISANLYIDKIRYTVNGLYGYIDIHYNASVSNQIAVNFDVNTIPEHQYRFTANSLEAVADAPSGETVLTTYNFNTNYYPDNVSTLNYIVLAEW